MRASSLPLLMKCTGAAVLPCVEGKSEAAEKAADWGTMVHYWAQTGIIRGPNKRAERALEKAIEVAGVDRLSLWPTGGVHEGALSIRVDGTREVSRRDDDREGWITGHYDYQYWLFQDVLWIDDLKTGKFYPNPEPGDERHIPDIAVGENRFPQDSFSPQQKTYGLALSELLSHDGPVSVSTTHWPRLPLSYRHAEPMRSWVNYSRQEMLTHWRALELIYEESCKNRRAMLGHEDELVLRPGDHCRFCPVRDCFVRQEFA